MTPKKNNILKSSSTKNMTSLKDYEYNKNKTAII